MQTELLIVRLANWKDLPKFTPRPQAPLCLGKLNEWQESVSFGKIFRRCDSTGLFVP